MKSKAPRYTEKEIRDQCEEWDKTPDTGREVVLIDMCFFLLEKLEEGRKAGVLTRFEPGDGP